MNWTETRARLIERGGDAARLPEEWQPGIDLRAANLSRADLSRADLSGVNLSGVKLTGANLSWADLSRADLSRANLSRAKLTGANLSWADLSRADLSRANLTGAKLTGANLSWADLSRANLTGANLSWANLSGAEGPFTYGYFGRHHAVAAGGYISIGSERHAYEWWWLNNYQKCGSRHGYTADEIADYGAWIRLAVARQQRIETTPPAA